MSDSYDEPLAFARELAGLAEAEILPRYQRCAVELKGDGSEVTEADRAAEAVMREAIGRRYPRHGIHGEEFGQEAVDARHVWVLDPLDGTRWFALGMPLFGTLVALLEDGDPVLGVIHMPVLRETVFAAHGAGCHFGDARGETHRVRSSGGTALQHARISASGTHASDIEPGDHGRPYRLGPVIRQAGQFRFCGDCLQHALVCRGNLEAAIDTIMAPWDIAAIVPCVEEAGGVVSSLSGEREQLLEGGSLLSSASAELHAQLLDQLRAD